MFVTQKGLDEAAASSWVEFCVRTEVQIDSRNQITAKQHRKQVRSIVTAWLAEEKKGTERDA